MYTHLALHAVIKLPRAFDRIQMNAFLRDNSQDFYTFQHTAPEPGQFTHDEGIT
jgi:hypothetical protein